MTKPNHKTSSPAVSADHLEQHSAEVAKQRGKSRTTNEDREAAYHEQHKTAPKVSEKDTPAH